MAFKMKGNPAKMGTIQGTAGHSSALKMKMEKDAAAKMKKEAAMKMKMESAAKMKKESAMKMKKDSPMDMKKNSPMDMKKDSPMDMKKGSAMKMKKDSSMKMKKESGMKMKKESGMKMKKESAMKAAKPDFPDIDGDGNTTESMKKAAADKKSGVKMKKASPAKQPLSPEYLKKNPSVKSKYREKADDPYAKALKKDPKLASYIKDRKKHKPGSAEYEALQAKINKAYGKTRSSKLKAAQIANQKKKDAAPAPKPSKIEVAKTKATRTKAEADEKLNKRTAQLSKREAKKKFGKDSKEFLAAKKAHLEAKEADRTGAKGGRKQGLFRKLSSRINKRRQANIDKKLAEKE